jgi:transposase-like protein
MEGSTRRGARLKAPALEACKGAKTLAQLSSEFGVHANQVRQWRKRLHYELPSLFSDGRKRQDHEKDNLISGRYRQIGQLKAEVDWLKKSLKCSSRREAKIDWFKKYPYSSFIGNVGYWGWSEPMHYYDSQRHYSYNQMLMGLINEQVTRTPF